MGYPGEVSSKTSTSRGDGVPQGRSLQGKARAGVIRSGRSVQGQARAGMMGFPGRSVQRQARTGVMGYHEGRLMQERVPWGRLFKDKQEQG